MKAPIKRYFTITKKEWNGLVVLVILIAGVLVAPYVYQLFHKDSTINFKDFDKAAAQLSKAEKNGGYQPDDSDAVSNGRTRLCFRSIQTPFRANNGSNWV